MEAHELPIQPYTADSGARIAAWAIDILPFGALTYLSEQVPPGGIGGFANTAVSTGLIGCSLLGFVLYQAYFLAKRAATPGKHLFHLAITSQSAPASSLALGRAIIRPLLTLIFAPLLPFIYSFAPFSRQRRHLIDLAVGTRVIQRHPRTEPRQRWLAGSILVVMSAAFCGMDLARLYVFFRLSYLSK